jgi:alpha-L-fucosidase
LLGLIAAQCASLAFGQATKEEIVDLSKVPQINETPEQRDARMQWFRDAKYGLFIHWGPCSVSANEIGWGRGAARPWDIGKPNNDRQRSEDPVYDNHYKEFNPVKYVSAHHSQP